MNWTTHVDSITHAVGSYQMEGQMRGNNLPGRPPPLEPPPRASTTLYINKLRTNINSSLSSSAQKIALRASASAYFLSLLFKFIKFINLKSNDKKYAESPIIGTKSEVINKHY